MRFLTIKQAFSFTDLETRLCCSVWVCFSPPTLVWFRDRFSSLGWPRSCYVANAGFELFLPLPPECGVSNCVLKIQLLAGKAENTLVFPLATLN